MSADLVNRSVTIVAQQFNPSVFTQLWLVKHEIIAEEEFESSSLFSQNLVQVTAKKFNLVVFAQQLQLAPLVEQPAEGALVSGTISRIVKLLPHTPYTAIGMNFIWHMIPTNETAQELSRRLFGRQDALVYRHFAADDALFGAYLSKDFLGWRMNLDVRPVGNQGSKEDRLQFAFNYHVDLTHSEKPADTISTMISAWDQARSAALEVVNSLQAES
jgi:hypothetical protein